MIYLEDTPYRILSHEKIKDQEGNMLFWLIDISAHKFQIIKKTFFELQADMTAGKLIPCVDTESYQIPILKAGDKAIADLRYSCIKGYVDKLYPNYTLLSKRGVPKEDMDKLANACGLSKKNTRRYVLNYLQSVGLYLSIVDKRMTRTLSEDYNPYAGNVRGRHRNGTANKVKNDDRLFALFEEAYSSFQLQANKYQYNSGSKYKPTLMGAYRAMIAKYFTTTDKCGNLVLLPEDQRPSYARFAKWVRDNKLNGDKVRNYAVSARDRRNNNRLLVGSSDYGVYNLMEMVEIDENESSFSLVSANPGTPDQAIGHAVTYLAVDVLSHRIVGASVAFVNNSYEGFMDLMDSMMLTDEENAYMFGVDYDESTPVFPGCMLPREIRVDHGSEYISNALTENLTGGNGSAVLEGVPIAINLVPVAMGSLKGLVERVFGIIHRHVQQALESGMGYVSGTHVAKHHQDAVLNIEDFRKIVYECIKLYNNTPIVDYPITPEMSAVMTIVTPNALWEFFAKTRLHGVDTSNEKIRAAARYGLMKNDKSFTLSRKQISYRNTLYWDIGDDENLIHQALQCRDGSETIDVRYDPRSVTTLYRADPKSGMIYRYGLAKKRPAMASFHNMRWPVADQWISDFRSNRYEAQIQKGDAYILSEAKTREIADQAAEAKGNGKNNTEDRRAYAQVERAALTAFDTARKNEIFYGDSSDPIVCTECEPEGAITVKPIAEHNPASEEIIPAVDLYDMKALAKIYDIEEE